MHYHAILFLEAVEQIDAISDHAQPLEDRPVEFSTWHRLFCANNPVQVTERTKAPDTPTPASAQHKIMLEQVIPLLDSDGTYCAVRKKSGIRWLASPKAIQKQLEVDRDLLVPISVIAAAQEAKRSAA